MWYVCDIILTLLTTLNGAVGTLMFTWFIGLASVGVMKSCYEGGSMLKYSITANSIPSIQRVHYTCVHRHTHMDACTHACTRTHAHTQCIDNTQAH